MSGTCRMIFSGKLILLCANYCFPLHPQSKPITNFCVIEKIEAIIRNFHLLAPTHTNLQIYVDVLDLLISVFSKTQNIGDFFIPNILNHGFSISVFHQFDPTLFFYYHYTTFLPF